MRVGQAHELYSTSGIFARECSFAGALDLIIICSYAGNKSPEPAHRSAASSFASQHVADARYGTQPARLLGVVADFLPQAMHQLLEQLPVAAAAMAPHMHQQPIGVYDLSSVCQQ
jgi:hypothetical protein